MPQRPVRPSVGRTQKSKHSHSSIRRSKPIYCSRTRRFAPEHYLAYWVF